MRFRFSVLLIVQMVKPFIKIQHLGKNLAWRWMTGRMTRFGWVKPACVVAVGHSMEIPGSPLVIII